MRILLIGNTGQLGWELERTLASVGEIYACDYPAIDLANIDNIRQVLHQSKPEIVVNAAAYTAVDQAETEPELAAAINSIAPTILAEETRKMRAGFIHFSTDYVFDGCKASPYVETDLPNPLNVYGLTKLQGEKGIQQIGDACLILRTSWVYSLRGDSFVKKVLGWARVKSSLKLVTDQISGPTWARMLAEITADLVLLGRGDIVNWLIEHHGLYHLAGSGYCSRFAWGQEVLRLDPHQEEQVTREILPALTDEFPSPARRPLFSALNCDKFNQAFPLRLPDWKIALKLAMELV